MKRKIEGRIAVIEIEIKNREARIETIIANLRSSVCDRKYDDKNSPPAFKAYQLVTFTPGFLRDLEYEQNKIRELEEQKRMLRFMLRED